MISASKLTPSQRFDILNQFIGFGNPNGKYWFIGMEEAGTWAANPDENNAMYEKYRNRFYPIEPGDNKGQIYRTISKFAVSLNSNITTTDQLKKASIEYKEKYLFAKDGETFQSNFYPLGKPKVKTWLEHYQKIFGISAKNYYDDIRQDRIRVLSEFSRNQNFQFTICFGFKASNWEEYKELFDLSGEHLNEYEEVNVCRIYKNRRIVLCPFFGYGHMKDQHILEVARKLRELCPTFSNSCT